MVLTYLRTNNVSRSKRKAINFSNAGTTNYLLTEESVDVSSPTDAAINCTFLSGFTGSAQCQVQYGTDPTYMTLPYSAVSTESGTAGDSVIVVLREQLDSSTVYYYTISAVSGDIIVTVQGIFTTPQYSKYVILIGKVHIYVKFYSSGVIINMQWH